MPFAGLSTGMPAEAARAEPEGARARQRLLRVGGDGREAGRSSRLSRGTEIAGPAHPADHGEAAAERGGDGWRQGLALIRVAARSVTPGGDEAVDRSARETFQAAGLAPLGEDRGVAWGETVAALLLLEVQRPALPADRNPAVCVHGVLPLGT